ncbi:hypothetical protein ScPMuIL_007873 [Solemya velum]
MGQAGLRVAGCTGRGIMVVGYPSGLYNSTLGQTSEWQKIQRCMHRSFWSLNTAGRNKQTCCLQVLSEPLRSHRRYTNSQSITGHGQTESSPFDAVPSTENENDASNSHSQIDISSPPLPSGVSVVNQIEQSSHVNSLTESSHSKQSVTTGTYKTQIQPSFNLAPYVNQSETLSELLKLGVDLSEVEKKPGAADLLVRLNYQDIKPYLYFLHDCGVADGKLGYVLTKNPFIFREPIEDLQVRVNYLKSKNFKREMILSVIERASLFLTMSVEHLDHKLGFYQSSFKLTGDEVRQVVLKLPKLITWSKDKFKANKFYMKEFLGFSDREMKEMFLACPKVYLTDKYQLGKKFDFLHNKMSICHADLVHWPNIFRCRFHLLKQRHQYLDSLQRAQYDPTKEHFVSLKALVSKTDSEWCEKVARTSVSQYNSFLKTL